MWNWKHAQHSSFIYRKQLWRYMFNFIMWIKDGICTMRCVCVCRVSINLIWWKLLSIYIYEKKNTGRYMLCILNYGGWTMNLLKTERAKGKTTNFVARKTKTVHRTLYRKKRFLFFVSYYSFLYIFTRLFTWIYIIKEDRTAGSAKNSLCCYFSLMFLVLEVFFGVQCTHA